MGIPPVTVGFLRGLGYEVVRLHGEGLDRLPDASILEKARHEGLRQLPISKGEDEERG